MDATSPVTSSSTTTATADKLTDDDTKTGDSQPNPPVTAMSTCLAGLATYVERLCALCEAGNNMGTLWSQSLEGDGGGMLFRLRAVLADLHSLAQLEGTQLNISVEAARKHTDNTQVGDNSNVQKLRYLIITPLKRYYDSNDINLIG